MNSLYTGFETNQLTFKARGNVKEFAPVMIEEGDSVYVPEEYEIFCGVCTGVKGDYVTVALHGCATLKYSGNIPCVGYQKLASKGDGTVFVDNDNGTDYLIVSIDRDEKTIEILI